MCKLFHIFVSSNSFVVFRNYALQFGGRKGRLSQNNTFQYTKWNSSEVYGWIVMEIGWDVDKGYAIIVNNCIRGFLWISVLFLSYDQYFRAKK